ncbi:MAG: YIP1 family protein [Thaumarchaeota archaeon]|nr:YIP1 family protein [Nitrososphaerota archaeon]
MNCPKCGTANPDGSVFCSSCGASLQASSASTTSPSLGASQQGSRVDEMRAVLSNAIALVKSPVSYMTRNKDQTVSLSSLMINYVAILALIPLVGRIIGDLLFYSGAKDSVGYAIAGSVVSYFLDLIAVFVIGIVIWKLAPSFKTTTNQAKATMLAAFIYTPVFLIGILSFVPVLGYLSILGLLYGLYILYLGLPIVLNTPKDKTVVYVIAVLVVSIIIIAIISLIIGGLDAVALK